MPHSDLIITVGIYCGISFLIVNRISDCACLRKIDYLKLVLMLVENPEGVLTLEQCNYKSEGPDESS